MSGDDSHQLETGHPGIFWPPRSETVPSGLVLMLLTWPLLSGIGIKLLEWGRAGADSGCGDPYVFCIPTAFAHAVITTFFAFFVSLAIAVRLSPLMAAPGRLPPDTRRARWLSAGALVLAWTAVFSLIALSNRA